MNRDPQLWMAENLELELCRSHTPAASYQINTKYAATRAITLSQPGAWSLAAKMIEQIQKGQTVK